MALLQEVRIRLVIALRKLGLIPTYQWVKLEIERARRKRVFVPKPIPDNAHVLIVCAYYEHPDWVRSMIESVRVQSFSTWTLVMVDDCSPTHSLESILEDLEPDKRILSIKSSENQGAYACRNQGVSYANEREIPWTHVTFIDPDDEAYSNWLEHALKCIGFEQGVVRVILERWDASFIRLKRRTYSHAPSMWNRNTWNQLRGFENVRVAGDTELLLRAKYSVPRLKFFYSVDPAQRCRVHGANASQTSLIERKRWLLKREQELRDK